MLADKKALTLSVAKRIAAAAEQEAIKNNCNIFVAIVDDGGNLMFLQRMDDCQLASLDVSIEKASRRRAFYSSVRPRRWRILSPADVSWL